MAYLSGVDGLGDAAPKLIKFFPSGGEVYPVFDRAWNGDVSAAVAIIRAQSENHTHATKRTYAAAESLLRQHKPSIMRQADAKLHPPAPKPAPAPAPTPVPAPVPHPHPVQPPVGFPPPPSPPVVQVPAPPPLQAPPVYIPPHPMGWTYEGPGTRLPENMWGWRDPQGVMHFGPPMSQPWLTLVPAPPVPVQPPQNTGVVPPVLIGGGGGATGAPPGPVYTGPVSDGPVPATDGDAQSPVAVSTMGLGGAFKNPLVLGLAAALFVVAQLGNRRH